MSVIIFIIILLILVTVHEFGHFYSAKKFGIRVDEFGFGFPPKLFGKKFGETEYSINLLPIGGFVRIFGENPDDENTNGPDRDRSFVHKAKWKQAIVLFAGIFANLVLAWLLFSFGMMSGMPTSVGNEPSGQALTDVHLVVISVIPESPAEIAGLKPGDKIVSLQIGKDATTYISPATVQSFVKNSNGKQIDLGYVRGKDTAVQTISISPRVSAPGSDPIIGISMDQIGTAKLPFFHALKEGMSMTVQMTKNTAIGLYNLIKNGIMGHGSWDGVSGPVGMVGIVGDAYTLGFSYLLSFAALISINLAIINVLPFPALDGGRLFFLLIEKIKGSPIKPNIANKANMIGFGLLILFMIIVTYHDVVHLL